MNLPRAEHVLVKQKVGVGFVSGAESQALSQGSLF